MVNKGKPAFVEISARLYYLPLKTSASNTELRQMGVKSIPYHDIFETSRDAILLFDRTHCIECNPATLRLFGTNDKHALLGDYCPLQFEQKKEPLTAFRRYESAVIDSLNQADFLFEWSFEHSDGRHITLETAIRAFDSNGKTIIMANVRDVSLRVQQQALIREKEARYRELIDSLHDGIMVLRFDGHSNDFIIVDINQAAAQIEGQPPSALISNELCRLYPFLETHVLLHTLRKVQATRQPDSLVYHFSEQTQPGESEHGWRDANIISLPNGELALVYNDISLQRQVESEIIKLSQAVKQSPTIIMITDKDGLIEYVNPKFTEVTGYDAREIIRQNPRVLSSGLTKKSVYQSLWETVKGGKTWRGEFINRRKNGKTYTEGASITPIRNNSGQITHYLAIKQDISQKKMTETRLKASEERFRTLFEESQDMIYIASPDGTILNINSAGVEALGYTDKQTLLKENLKNHYLDKSLWDNKIDILRYTKGMKDLETVMYRRDGTAMHVTESINAVYDADKDLVALRGTIRDVSDAVRRRKELEAINSELTEANQQIQETQSQLIQQEKLASIGNLAAGIAHELNNPLGFVSSNFLTLHKYISIFTEYISIWQQVNSDELTQEQLRSIAEQAESFYHEKHLGFILEDLNDLFSESREGFSRMISIVENMRSFSRIDQSDSAAPYDINQGIDNTLTVARNEFKYVADIRKELMQMEPFLCRGDQINQVLLNILVNAAQAIKGQNRKDKGTITIRTREEADQIVCEVEDDGPGITPEIQGKIFDPFFTTKPVGEGTGLGLNISYDIVVNKHKGMLSVSSEPGMGSVFTVCLPKKLKQ